MVSVQNEPGENCPRDDLPVFVSSRRPGGPRKGGGLDLVVSFGRMRPTTGPFQTAGLVVLPVVLH